MMKGEGLKGQAKKRIRKKRGITGRGTTTGERGPSAGEKEGRTERDLSIMNLEYGRLLSSE